MVLSDANKQVIHHLAETLHANAATYGADALARLFEVHPQTKTYFPSFTGYHATDPEVIAHGTKVFDAVAKAAGHLDNLAHHLEKLAKKHGIDLLVDPHNFVLFSNIIVVTLAIHLPTFTPATHTAVDKFLEEIAHQLSSRLFATLPQTKTYFPGFSGYLASHAQVKAHGAKVMKAVAMAIDHLDNLPKHLEKLAKKHGLELLVDPHNFGLIAGCIEITLAVHLPSFSLATHCAVDKFLQELRHQMTSNYRLD